MEKEGIKPDHITFKAILRACFCRGYFELGREYFEGMVVKYYIIPRLKHYDCMIELYGQYGFMDELEDFVKSMPFVPTVQMLTRVFDACREHRSSSLGEWAANKLNELNPSVPFRFEQSVRTADSDQKGVERRPEGLIFQFIRYETASRVQKLAIKN
ncbi:hypothetical protein LguiB_011228 [Lonicera macranthoides]